MNSTLQPVIISIFRRGYDRHRFIGDLASGITLLGGSSVQVSGPTGAFVVVVYSIVQRYGYDGLAVATLLAGLMLCLMGLLRMGTVLRFIPYPLTVGFTSGIALIIFSSQIKDFLGLETGELPANFVEKWAVIGASLGATSPSALAIGTLSLLILIAWPRITHRVPGSLVAIVIATLAVPALDLEVATIGSRYGVVPNTLPEPRLPSISWSLIVELFSPAFTIALLGAIESLLSAVVADGMTGERHKSNAELFAQGIGNILSPLFSGIPATGAIARTATNIKSGGRTPVAAVIHAVTLLTIMYLFAPWAALIPLPALAAILIIVAYHMSERRSFAKMFRGPRSDLAVLSVED
ncbi:MAG: sodium-independent anion transporter, partial [Proteobacteria bacterium]